MPKDIIEDEYGDVGSGFAFENDDLALLLCMVEEDYQERLAMVGGAPRIPGDNFYVTEDSAFFYGTEDGLSDYVPEN